MPDPTGTEVQAEDESQAAEDAAERLPADIDAAILRRYFTLSDADFGQIGQCRGASNKLGFSVQLCSLRWRGYFLVDMRDVPAAVLQVLATQIGVLPMPLGEYPQDDKTRSAHLERIRQHLGFVRCDPTQRQRLLGYLTNMARDAPRTEVLRKSAYAWLLAQRVVRPGRTTLRDLVARAREAGLQQLYDALTRDLTQAQCAQLDGLLATAETRVEVDGRTHVEVGVEPEAEPHSQLERFKVAPHRESPAVLIGLLERLETINGLGFTDWGSPSRPSAAGWVGLPVRRLELAAAAITETLRRPAVLSPGSVS